jgi:hypothetical protein
VLTIDQRAQLDTTGVTRIPGVVAPAEVDVMAGAVWRHLARRGIERDQPRTWPEGYLAKHQGLRQARVFDVYENERTAAVVEELLGAGPVRASSGWGPALITFPQPGPWTVPHKIWHFDVPGAGDPDQIQVARLFGYATDVGPRGGATVVVEGSHELVRRMVASSPTNDAGSSADLRKKLRRHRWFRALATDSQGDRITPFMVDGDEIDGVRVRVAELTGNAGDLVVMLPWTMHSMSRNVAATPRIMVTQSIYRA